MKSPDQSVQYALKTLAALKLASVVKVYEGAVVKVSELFESGLNAHYIGVKNTDVISNDFRQHMNKDIFIVHTLDALSQSGRAVDIGQINPITGRYMTGSSSGTALNVFYNINDIGIGTDGGGSVLAPALSLNLYAMISPLIDQQALRKHSKVSTDGIVFTPSIGFISKELSLIQSILERCIDVTKADKKRISFAPSPHRRHTYLNEKWSKLKLSEHKTTVSYDGLHRQHLIEDLQTFDFESKILVTCEGAIDTETYGDSVMGHYDVFTQNEQSQGGKYYLKVVNMLNLSAVVVPSEHHATGFLVICTSTPPAIWQALQIATQLQFERSQLEARYFNLINTIMEDTL